MFCTNFATAVHKYSDALQYRAIYLFFSIAEGNRTIIAEKSPFRSKFSLVAWNTCSITRESNEDRDENHP